MFITKRRVLKINLEREFKTIIRGQSRHLIPILHLNGLSDADIAFGCPLLNQACTLQHKDEGTGAAIHNGNFCCIQIYKGVIDTKTREGRHQVLNGRDGRPIFHQGGGEAGIAYTGGTDCNMRTVCHIDTAEHDTGILWSGSQREVDLFPRVQSNTCRVDLVF